MAENKVAVVTECAICLEVLFAPEKLVCGHIFCSGCVQQLYDTTCPLCRAQFVPSTTMCRSCEQTISIEKSKTHTCMSFVDIVVISKKLHCPTCNEKLRWCFQHCSNCNIHGELKDQREQCNARVLFFWARGEPLILLDENKSFCPNWGSGWTSSLRLWVLHKDGTMSHFAKYEIR